MGSDLMQVLGIIVGKLVAKKHCLFDPGRDGRREDILLKTLLEGHKDQVFPLMEILGSVQIVTQSKVICPL